MLPGLDVEALAVLVDGILRAEASMKVAVRRWEISWMVVALRAGDLL